METTAKLRSLTGELQKKVCTCSRLWHIASITVLLDRKHENAIDKAGDDEGSGRCWRRKESSEDGSRYVQDTPNSQAACEFTHFEVRTTSIRKEILGYRHDQRYYGELSTSQTRAFGGFLALVECPSKRMGCCSTCRTPWELKWTSNIERCLLYFAFAWFVVNTLKFV